MVKNSLFFQKTLVWLLAPKSGDSQLPQDSAPGHPKSSIGACIHMPKPHADSHIHIIKKKKIFLKRKPENVEVAVFTSKWV